MPILLIIEDGSGVANANSYATLAQTRQFATDRGISLPSVDDEIAAMLIKAVDYLESVECKYQGARTSIGQSLAWPRKNVTLNGVAFPANVIPKNLVNAQIQCAIAINAGFDLLPNYGAEDMIVKEKTGPIETEYADPLQVDRIPTISAANALLAPLFGECFASKGYGVKTVRV